MSSTSKIKSIFESIAGLFLMVGLFALSIGLIVLFLKGATFMAEQFLPFLSSASAVLFWVLLLIALPISFIKATRGVMSIVFLISSYVFGLTGWLIGFVLTYYYWGAFWLIVGLFLGGIGVVPLGLLASGFNDGWGQFWNLLFILVLTYATRFYGFWLSEKYEEYSYNKSSKHYENEDLIDGEVVEDRNALSEDYTYINRTNFSINDDTSILLVGETGTGKSELVHSLLEQLKTSYTPDEVNFVLFDLKQVEFQDEDVEYLYKDVITSVVTGVRVLRELVEYADLRIKKRQKFPAIVIYVEECDIAAQHQEKFDKLMISLIDKAKKANFCIIYSTSRVSKETVGYELLKHFEVILASRLPKNSTKYLGIEDTSEISGHNFIRIDNQQISRYTHPTSTDDFDTLVEKAKRLIMREGRASTALLQRELHIGYGMAARIMDELEELDLVGAADGAKPREVKIGKKHSTSKVLNTKDDDELSDWESIKDKE